MTSNDGGSVHQSNQEGLNPDAVTQSNLSAEDSERGDDGFRRDEFGNRVNDQGERVDPDGRLIDASGNAINEEGQRVGDDGKPLDDGDDSVIDDVVPPVPPMMGR